MDRNTKGSKRIGLIVVVGLISLFLLLLILAGISLIFGHKKRSSTPETEEARCDNVFAIWSHDGKMLYQDIVEATEEFCSDYCIGVGGFVSVYRAVLPTAQGQEHNTYKCSFSY